MSSAVKISLHKSRRGAAEHKENRKVRSLSPVYLEFRSKKRKFRGYLRTLLSGMRGNRWRNLKLKDSKGAAGLRMCTPGC